MQTMEPPCAHSGEVRRKTAERPSQEPISRIRGLRVLMSGIKDVQGEMLPENQSWVSVNLYPLDSFFGRVTVESCPGGKSTRFQSITFAHHTLLLHKESRRGQERRDVLFDILPQRFQCLTAMSSLPLLSLPPHFPKWVGFCIPATLSVERCRDSYECQAGTDRQKIELEFGWYSGKGS